MYLAHHYIFRLYVSVSNSTQMKGLYCLAKSLNYLGCFYLLVFSFFLELSVKRPTIEIFKEKVNMFFVIKNCINCDDVRMVEGGLDSDFKCKLIYHHALLNSCLWNSFEGEYRTTFFVNRHENIAKSTLSQFFSKNKIINAETRTLFIPLFFMRWPETTMNLFGHISVRSFFFMIARILNCMRRSCFNF